MNTLWLKIKIWTKIAVLAIVTIYALFFIAKNSEDVKVWYWFGRPTLNMPALLLIFLSILVGVIGALLARTTFKTIRQIRELRERSRIERLERLERDQKTKAAMLKTRDSGVQQQPAAPTDPTAPPSE